jgi:hypothetical protein
MLEELYKPRSYIRQLRPAVCDPCEGKNKIVRRVYFPVLPKVTLLVMLPLLFVLLFGHVWPPDYQKHPSIWMEVANLFFLAYYTTSR